jgi:hypothetical protein
MTGIGIVPYVENPDAKLAEATSSAILFLFPLMQMIEALLSPVYSLHLSYSQDSWLPYHAAPLSCGSLFSGSMSCDLVMWLRCHVTCWACGSAAM